MGDKRELSVVIPAYNEAERIGPTLEAISSNLKKDNVDYEIIVVSDGSIDATEDIVRNYAKDNARVRLIDYSPNRGKGHAVRTGILEARADDVLFSDADLATPIEDLGKLRQAAKDRYEVVIGSRALKDSVIIGWRPWYRELSGKVFNMIIRLLAVPGIHDTQCGFKYFTGGSATRIFSATRLDGFGFDVEALYLARKFGFNIGEIGVHWQNSPATKVSVIKHTLPMLIEVVRVRLNDRKKLYERPTIE
jgi:dolichyl-phosphate beta-glucosyltransferase